MVTLRRRAAAAIQRVLPSTPDARALRGRVAGIPYWCHSIDLGCGVVTPGIKTPEYQAKELESLHLPDLRGKSVLDIGAWDGFYSFPLVRIVMVPLTRRPRRGFMTWL
jgi:hypothetical protein